MHKISKNVLSSCVLSICLIALLISGCTIGDSGKGASVNFEQLLSNPSQYNGKEITIEGFVFLGFETMVLSEELKKSGYAEGHLISGERMLWIEGGIPTDIHDKLLGQQTMGPFERYGKVLAKGTFQYGGHYGHLGA
ncbi:hypothetical protein ACFLTP_08810 [Chloroflexota bacterium]